MRSVRLKHIQCHPPTKWQSRETNPIPPFHYAMLLHKIRNWLLTQSSVIMLVLVMLFNNCLYFFLDIFFSSSSPPYFWLPNHTAWASFLPASWSQSWPEPTGPSSNTFMAPVLLAAAGPWLPQLPGSAQHLTLKLHLLTLLADLITFGKFDKSFSLTLLRTMPSWGGYLFLKVERIQSEQGYLLWGKSYFPFGDF